MRPTYTTCPASPIGRCYDQLSVTIQHPPVHHRCEIDFDFAFATDCPERNLRSTPSSSYPRTPSLSTRAAWYQSGGGRAFEGVTSEKK